MNTRKLTKFSKKSLKVACHKSLNLQGLYAIPRKEKRERSVLYSVVAKINSTNRGQFNFLCQSFVDKID